MTNDREKTHDLVPTPALRDAPTGQLLKLPAGDRLQQLRDRALLSVLFHHGLRREEVCSLTVSSMQQRRGVPHLRIHGKGGKVRNIPLHPATQSLLLDYLEASGHKEGPVFRPICNNRTGTVDRARSPDGVYKIMRGYSAQLGVPGGPHVGRDGRDQCAQQRCGHRKGAEMARALGHLDDSRV